MRGHFTNTVELANWADKLEEFQVLTGSISRYWLSRRVAAHVAGPAAAEWIRRRGKFALTSINFIGPDGDQGRGLWFSPEWYLTDKSGWDALFDADYNWNLLYSAYVRRLKALREMNQSKLHGPAKELFDEMTAEAQAWDEMLGGEPPWQIVDNTPVGRLNAMGPR